MVRSGMLDVSILYSRPGSGEMADILQVISKPYKIEDLVRKIDEVTGQADTGDTG